jgi:hypothetical protein
MEDFVRFLTEIVDPTVKEFAANPGSARQAFLACVVTLHSVDYLAYDRKLSKAPKGALRAIQEQFCKQSPDFKLVDEVAHAFKHVVSTRRPDRRLKSEEVIRRGGFSRDFSSDFDVIRVTIKGHPEVDLLETVKRAVIFLREKG